jgi:hypothetical protein
VTDFDRADDFAAGLDLARRRGSDFVALPRRLFPRLAGMKIHSPSRGIFNQDTFLRRKVCLTFLPRSLSPGANRSPDFGNPFVCRVDSLVKTLRLLMHTFTFAMHSVCLRGSARSYLPDAFAAAAFFHAPLEM